MASGRYTRRPNAAGVADSAPFSSTAVTVAGGNPSTTAGAREGVRNLVKKGRHRRYEEARGLKRSPGIGAKACVECGAEPEDIHATWCLAEDDSYERILGEVPSTGSKLWLC